VQHSRDGPTYNSNRCYSWLSHCGGPANTGCTYILFYSMIYQARLCTSRPMTDSTLLAYVYLEIIIIMTASLGLIKDVDVALSFVQLDLLLIT